MKKYPTYLDYMATTPVDKRVVKVMLPYLSDPKLFGNASSDLHIYGKLARDAIEKAANQVATTINASPNEIIWTSGATESNNIAIKGATDFYKRKGKHIISTTIEHKSILDTLAYLKTKGFEITLIKPNKNGLIDINYLKKSIRPDTILISIHHVNSEIGVIQDVSEIGELAHENGIIFHVDAAQSPGKVPIDVNDMNVDLMSLSAHKVYGPKGVGALYLRQKPIVRLNPIMHGGGQQRGIRPGTLPTHLIVGMGEAFNIAKEEFIDDHEHIAYLNNTFMNNLIDLPGVHINGDMTERIPHNINLSIIGVNGEALVCAIRNFAISTTSACSTGAFTSSHVLKAIGVNEELIQSSIRISFGRFTTQDDVIKASKTIKKQIIRLRNMAN